MASAAFIEPMLRLPNQRVQPLLPRLTISLQHLVDRAEVRLDLLSLAGAQVTVREHEEARLLDRLEYVVLLLAKLVEQTVDFSGGRWLPRLRRGFRVSLARDWGNCCVCRRMTIVSGRFMSAEGGGPVCFEAAGEATHVGLRAVDARCRSVDSVGRHVLDPWFRPSGLVEAEAGSRTCGRNCRHAIVYHRVPASRESVGSVRRRVLFCREVPVGTRRHTDEAG